MKNNIYTRVFGLLFLGVFVSFLTGYFLSLNPSLVIKVMGGGYFYILVILELAVVIVFSLLIKKMNKYLAYFCYFLYSILTGFTLSVIFLAYSLNSILLVFLLTSIILAVFALYGYFTKHDLSNWGMYLFVALLGIIVASIINIFLGNTTLDLIISIVGILVFVLYVAYDVNKVIPNASYMLDEEKGAIYGAFQVYLDFINIFLDLIRIFGKNNDN